MHLYYALRNLSNYLGYVRSVFYELRDSIRNVYIIGRYLASWFGTIGGYFGYLENAADDAAAEWWRFYNWIANTLRLDERIRDLMRYADDIIAFIRFPFDFIGDTIRDYFPDLRELTSDPVSYVLEILYRYTGLGYDFIHNPVRFIDGMIDSALGSLRYIVNDPDGWLIDKVSNIIPDFYTLIHSPADWVKARIDERFPLLDDFLRDPDSFLRDRLEDFIDAIGGRYRDKAVQVFEKIVNAIF